MADAGAAVSMAPAEPVVCDCQPAALRRALRNLVDNAVTYGTSAEVAVSVTARSVTVTVDDRGPGIPEAELARVVEPFYRLEASRNRATGGIGLGLAIAAAVAAAHGGELILANRREGGLRATLRLPR
jgi:signal transduction histidine kinase